jgi:hypothetical protein
MVSPALSSRHQGMQCLTCAAMPISRLLQNTYVDMEHFGPYLDRAMAAAGIKPVPNPIPVSLN